MATMQEIRNTTVEDAKQAEHNALIKERYRRLQNAELEQFNEEYAKENSATDNVRASVVAPERTVYAPTEGNAVEQQPQITEFVHIKKEAPVFTTEKFNNVPETGMRESVAPQAVAAPVIEMPVAPVASVNVASVRQAEYSLTPLAKMVLAAFAAVVVVLFSLICVNTNVIRQKKIQLKNLEQQRQDLIETNEEIQRRIDSATSEDTIREYALSHGMIEGAN